MTMQFRAFLATQPAGRMVTGNRWMPVRGQAQLTLLDRAGYMSLSR